MSLLDQIRNAQRDAGEAAVIAHLDSLGLSNVTDKKDPYASEEETAALIKPDSRSPEEKGLHTMMDARGAWEQGVDSISVLRDIALELLTEQTNALTNDRRTKACLMACEGVSTEDLEAVMVNTGPLLKNKLAEADLLRAANANMRTPSHPDDLAVDRFAAAMKAKMAKQRTKGYGGWDDPECPAERLQRMLAEHLAKGDPIDVGNFAMMLWARGESTATQPAAESVAEACCGQYETCAKACTPKGRALEHREAAAQALECKIDSADFEDNTITLKVKSQNWKVSAGTYWLGITPLTIQDNQNHGDI